VPLNLQDKKAIVAKVADVVTQSVSVIAADYRGSTVSQMTELRTKGRDVGVEVRVLRNTLAHIAVEQTPYKCLQETLVGPIVLLFSQREPGAAAKLLRDLSKTNANFQVKGIAMSGQLLGPEKLEAVASLPTKDEAIAQLMSVMIAPVTQLVRTLVEPYAMATRAMAAIGDQKAA